jgi:type IV pilus assembly protein PilO
MKIILTKLPWHAQIGAFVVLAVAGCGAFYYYIEMPARADMASRQAQLVALRADITKGLATAKKLPEFRAQVAELESRLENLKAVLPEEKDASDLLRRMQTEAARSNLEIKSFKPSPTITKQLHAEWPFSLELEGTYLNLAMFFDRVGKFTRIVNISGLDVKGKAKPEPNSTITATCVATTFVLLDKPAPDKPTGKPGAKPGAKPAKPAAPAGAGKKSA